MTEAQSIGTRIKSRRWRTSDRRPPAVLFVPAVIIAALSLLPVCYLLYREGVNFDRLRRLLKSPTTGPLIEHSALLVVCVTSASVVLGVALAMLVARTDLPGRRIWTVLFTLPLGIPAFVTSYTWVAAGYRYAPKSTFIYGLRGSVIILTLSLFPYVYLPTVAALRGLDASQEEAARALGRGPLGAFFAVTAPQLQRAVSGGALIIALHMLAEYGALELLRYRTLTTAIVQRATVLGSPEAARALSLVLTVVALVVLAADQLILRRRLAPIRTGGGVPRPAAPWRLGMMTPVALLVSALLVALSLGAPLFFMVDGLRSSAIDWRPLIDAASYTAQYAAETGVVVTLAALPIAMLAVRHASAPVRLIERATWVAHSLPGVVVSLSLVYFAVRWVRPLYQTSWLLVFGYAILYLPIAVGAQQVGIIRASSEYDNVARSLGRGPFATFLRITTPLALPGILSGAMLVMMNVGKELTMTLLLRPTGAETLATALWNTTNGEVLDFTSAAPFAVTLVLLTAFPTYWLIRTSLNPDARARSARLG